MGVLGLTPFIQKYCPEVIRELPHRLKSLAGKTIAIDGTLITQRLHFAPMPYENRHVLGWYRLIRELRESGVGVICVFDGRERSLAKQRENQRRRKAARMEVARGAMEADRLRRLKDLTRLWKQYHKLPEDERTRSGKTLKDVINKNYRTITPAEHLHPVLHRMDSDFSKIALDPFMESASPYAFKENPLPPHPINVRHDSTLKIFQALQEAAAPPAETLSPSEPNQVRRVIEFQNKEHTSEDPSNVVSEAQNLRAHGSQILPADDTQSNRRIVEQAHTDPSVSTPTPVQHDSQQEPTLIPSLTDVVSEPPKLDKPRLSKYTQVSTKDLETLSSTITSSKHDIGQATLSTVDLGLSGIPVKDFDEVEDENLDEYVEDDHFPDFFEPPLNVYFNTFGLVNPLQSYTMEPPDDRIVDEVDNALCDLDNSEIDRKSTTERPAELAPQGITEQLVSLFQDYERSVPAIMTPPMQEAPAKGDVDPSDTEAGAREQYAMSKHQIQLTADEGSLWQSFVNPFTVDMEERLHQLSQRSEHLTKSYEKRNNPPTTKTYEDCKVILQAMGIPVIETVVPYEAEALAASLVHYGFADYVASEDTDVLVFEAPLIRNITNRAGPLTVLSGAEIRQTLQLDRASYVDFALLLGTDFSQRIKNLGPHRAIKLIRTHRRIEQVIANEPKFTPRMPPAAYLQQVELARLVFETLPPVPDPELLRQTEWDDASVMALLEKFGVYHAAQLDWDNSGALDSNYYKGKAYFKDNPAMF